nr:hypothetical protein HK105_007092 [Polyrhizophydium stewartii]
MDGDDRSEKLAAARRKLQQFQKKRTGGQAASPAPATSPSPSPVLAHTALDHAAPSAAAVPASPTPRTTLPAHAPPHAHAAGASPHARPLSPPSAQATARPPSRSSAASPTAAAPGPLSANGASSHASSGGPLARTLAGPADGPAAFEQLLREKNQLSATIDRMAEALQRISDEKADMHLEISRLTLELNDLFRSQGSRTSDMERMQRELDAAQIQIRDLLEQQRVASIENQNLAAGVRLKTETIGRLEQSLVRLEQWSNEREEQLKQLTLVQAGASSEQTQSLELAIADKDMAIAQLSAQLDSQRTTISQLQSAAADARASSSNLEAALADSQTRNEALQQRITLIEAENAQLRAALDAESAARSQERAELEAQLAEKTHHLSALAVMHAEHEQDSRQYTRLSEQLSAAAKRTAQLQDENKQLIDQLNELRARNVTITNEKLEFVEMLYSERQKAIA